MLCAFERSGRVTLTVSTPLSNLASTLPASIPAGGVVRYSKLPLRRCVMTNDANALALVDLAAND